MPTSTSIQNKAAALALLKTQVTNCRKCPLGYERIQAVFSVGNPKSPLVFIGEAPGFQEDHRGEPFIGRAGELLNKMIEEVLGLKRQDIYITNVVKCHPMTNPKNPEAKGNDRPPTKEEIEACHLWWQGEMEIIKPKIVCVLGASALSAILGEKVSVGEYKGKTFTRPNLPGITLFVTYHPAAILRNMGLIDNYKDDFRKLKAILGSVTHNAITQ